MSSRNTRRIALGLLLVGSIGGYAWWRDGGKRLFHPRNWGVVEEGWLYRSGQIHPRIIEDVLREQRIDVVIDLARDDPRVESNVAELEAVERLGIRKVDAFGLDGSGLGDPDAYPRALIEIVRARDAGQRVLVHCSAGSQRTGGAIALYRMLYSGWSGRQAYEEYLSYRNRPPKHRNLIKFINAGMPDWVNRLVEAGALDRAPPELPVFGP